MRPILACLTAQLSPWDVGEPAVTWPVLVAGGVAAMAQVYLAFLAWERLRALQSAAAIAAKGSWSELRMLPSPGWVPEAIALVSLVLPSILAFALAAQDIDARTIEWADTLYMVPARRIGLLHAALALTVPSWLLACIALPVCMAARVRLAGFARAATAALNQGEPSRGQPYRACPPQPEAARAWAAVPGPRLSHLLFVGMTWFAMVIAPAAGAAHLSLSALVDSLDCRNAAGELDAGCQREHYTASDRWASVGFILPLTGLIPTLLALALVWIRPYRRRHRLAPGLPAFPSWPRAQTGTLCLAACVGSVLLLWSARHVRAENDTPVRRSDNRWTQQKCAWSSNPRGKPGSEPIPQGPLVDLSAHTVNGTGYADVDALEETLKRQHARVPQRGLVVVCGQDLDTSELRDVLRASMFAGYGEVSFGMSRPEIERRPLFGEVEGCSYSSVHATLVRPREAEAISIGLFDSCWQLQDALANYVATGRTVRLAL